MESKLVPKDNLENVCQCPCDDHTCPYQEDVNNDSEFTCNCCTACTHECAMDI